jgi:hypothetical protein
MTKFHPEPVHNFIEILLWIRDSKDVRPDMGLLKQESRSVENLPEHKGKGEIRKKYFPL